MKKGPRDVQTRVKHQILDAYLRAWAGIIGNGVALTAKTLQSKGRSFESRLIYVDAFAYRGRYEGETSDITVAGGTPSPVWGSPIIGAKALDDAAHFAASRGFHFGTMTVAVEEDRQTFADLQLSINLAGLGTRAIVNPPGLQFKDEKIALIHCNFQATSSRVLSLTGDRYTWSFYLLDPYGPKGIPYDLVQSVVSQNRTDVMINFPYQDLHKKAGILFRSSPISLSQVDKALLANYDALFGTQVWREVAAKAVENAPVDEWGMRVEDALSDYYMDRLRDADQDLAVKRIRIEFPDRDRTMYYLFLTTHDATGALAMNKVLWDGKLNQQGLKWLRSQAAWVKRSHEDGQATLFDVGVMDLSSAAPVNEESRVIDVSQLAEYIYKSFRGRTATRLDIFRFLADESDVFPEDVNRALRALKSSKRVDYKQLSHHERMQFL